MRRVWRNGIFLPETEAVCSIYDSSFLYTDGTFEMLRSFGKQPFKLDAHLDRLLNSIKFLDLPCEYNFWQLKRAVWDTIFANRFEFEEDDEYRIFIHVSRGPLPIYKEILECEPWLMISIYPLRWTISGISRFYLNGRSAVITSQRATPSRFLENKVKNHCRLSSRLAELEAKRSDPDAWPLLVDDLGHITESTGANFFCVHKDRLLTPTPENCLRGISRNYILHLAREHGLEYRERDITPYDAITASEAFFTCTPFSILPCTKINGRAVGNGVVGKVTEFLSEKWEEAVKCQWREQARRWDEQTQNK